MSSRKALARKGFRLHFSAIAIMRNQRAFLSVVFVIVGLCFMTCAYGNAEIRDWNLKDGSELRGEIDEVDESAETVTLKDDKGDVVVVLGPVDKIKNL